VFFLANLGGFDMVSNGNSQSKKVIRPDENQSVSHEMCGNGLIFNNLIWLTTREAAIYLRKFTSDGKPSEGAIRSLVCRGQIKARKFLRRLYFKREELDRLIETSQLVGGY
jgi:hypothetical protein